MGHESNLRGLVTDICKDKPGKRTPLSNGRRGRVDGIDILFTESAMFTTYIRAIVFSHDIRAIVNIFGTRTHSNVLYCSCDWLYLLYKFTYIYIYILIVSDFMLGCLR